MGDNGGGGEGKLFPYKEVSVLEHPPPPPQGGMAWRDWIGEAASVGKGEALPKQPLHIVS